MPQQYAKKYSSDHEGKDTVVNRFRRARKVDEIIDESRASQKPEWRGDHSFSSDAARYSLTNFVEPEVAREHPDWTTSQVKEHAKERFEKRLAQDLSYEHRETVHEESEVHWRPVQTENGWELATEYGDKLVTLNELWDHTKEYAAFVGNPAAYNPEEHRAQLAMQDALINDGSRGFVSVLSHPDAVRYVQIWQKSESGDIQSRHVDLFATTGRDFSPQEAAELIYHLADYHGKDRAQAPANEGSHAHFFVSQGHIAEGDVRTIAIAQAISVDVMAFPGDDGRNIRSPHLIGAVMRDTKDAALSFGKYIHDHIEEKIHRVKPDKTERPDHKALSQKIIEHKKNNQEKHTEGKSAAGVVPEMNTRVNKAAEFIAMKSVLSEWWISRTVVAFVPHLPVAAPAAVFWFAEFSGANEIKKRTEVKRTADGRAPKDAIRRGVSTRDILTVWKTLITKVRTFRITPEKKKKETITPAATSEKITEKKLHTHDSAVETPLVSEKPDQRFVLVYEAAQMFSQFFTKGSERPEGKNILSPMNHGQPRQAEVSGNRETAIAALVGRLLFAVSIWELCRMPLPAKTGIHYPDGKSDMPLTQKEMQGGERADDDAAPVPWILLSIIWHLSMMREAAVVAPLQQQSQGTQVKGKNTPLPQCGVIFTYHFVIE